MSEYNTTLALFPFAKEELHAPHHESRNVFRSINIPLPSKVETQQQHNEDSKMKDTK
jgi:hypothetical protein